MKKITLMAALLGSAYFANAQVGIGTPTPAEAALLHIQGTDKGVIIPNVKLTATNNYAPITGAEVQSLLVYNTNISGDTSTTGVTAGFYYWENSAWQRITTKAELDAAVGNVTNVQADLNKIKDLLTVVYPANNLDSPSTTGTSFGGGLIYSPTPDSTTGSHVGYVYFDSNTSTYKTQVISLDSFGFSETKTYFKTINNKQYFVSEGFKGDSGTITGTEPGVYLIDVVGGVVNNFNEIIGDTTTVININGDTTTIANYFNSLGADSNTVYFNSTADTATVGTVAVPAYTFYLKDGQENAILIDSSSLKKNADGTYLFTAIDGDTTTIDIPEAVINNITKILGDTTTIEVDGRTFTTVEQYLQHIIGNGDANVGYTTTPIAADSTTGQIAIPANSFYYVDVNGNKQYIDIKSFETLTALKGDSSTGEISYTPERGDTQTVNVIEMVTNNFGKIVGDTTTVVTINGDTTTINEYFNSLVSDSSTLTDNGDGTYTFVSGSGNSVTINIPASVVNNFEQILGDTTTYNGDTLTIKQIIEQIAAEKSGNMTFVPGADTSTTELMLAGSKFVYVKSNGDTETISFSALVEATETTTFLERRENPSNAGVVITYDYLNEDSATSTILLTSDIKTLIDGNTDIKNAIQNVLNAGGNVYYTADLITADSTTNNLVIPANSFYTINNGVKKVVTVPVSIEQIVTAIQGADSTTINILKTELGNNFADSSTTNNIVKTGDTWNDGMAIYKGIYQAYVVGKTALVSKNSSDSPTAVANTVAIPLGKTNVGDIISITVLKADGSKITTSTTDVSVSGDALKFSIGTGNMYNVLFPQATSNTEIKVLVEFSAE